VEGAFLIEAGISSSYHIANFFGLTERVSQPNEVARPVKTPTIPSAATVSLQSPDLVATLWPRTTLVREAKPREVKPREAAPPHEPKRSIDVSAVITRALTAAGLMK
jgi:hypothetical protein